MSDFLRRGKHRNVARHWLSSTLVELPVQLGFWAAKRPTELAKLDHDNGTRLVQHGFYTSREESRLLMQKIPNFIFPGQPSTPICFPHTYALCPVPRGACRLRKITGFCLANSSLTVASLSLNFPKQDPTHATNFLEPGVSIEASCGPGCILLRFFLGNCDSMLPSSCL